MSQIVRPGEEVVFTVGVLDEGCAFTYAWRHFVNILGATNPTFRIVDVQPPPAGNKAGPYDVVVTDVSGSVTSSVVYLTLVTGPFPSKVCAPAGTDVSFTNIVYTDNNAGPVNHQWLFKGQEIPGATNSILMLRNVQPSQAGSYSAMVCNPAGCVMTPEAFLNIEPLRPRLWGIRLESDSVRFHVTCLPFDTYRIQASSNFIDWFDVSTNTAPESGTFEVWDPTPPRDEWRCYRAVQP